MWYVIVEEIITLFYSNDNNINNKICSTKMATLNFKNKLIYLKI